ncbi:MAG: hypothetical protein ACP5H5_10615, partial [Pyrobaculum sp.]
DSWPKLHDDLKTILSYKIALKLELEPEEARKALDLITGEGYAEKIEEALRQFHQGKSARVYDRADFEAGAVYKNVKVRDGRLVAAVFRGPGEGERRVPVVTAGTFGKLVKKVVDRVEGGGVAALIGPRGVGKSTAAAAALYVLLRRGYYVAVVERGDAKEILSIKNA